MAEVKCIGLSLSKMIGIIFFVLLIFLSIFSSMCPKYVPVVEVPLYCAIVLGGIYWIYSANTKKSVFIRVMVITILGISINLSLSSFIHNNGFPFKMFDNTTQKKILAHQQKMLDSIKIPKE